MKDLRLFLLHHKKGNKFRKFLNSWDSMTITTKHSGRYYHEYCMLVAVDEYFRLPDSITQSEFSEFEEWITETLRDYARELYKSLEKEYNYLTSEKAIIETIEANDYEFTEDGKIY